MANTPTDSAAKPPTTLLDLPQELQDNILDLLLFSTTIYIEQGARHDLPADSDFAELNLSNTDLARLPDLPDEIASLKLVCRQFNKTVGKDWHSKITYHFPSVVSFIDVLRQWPAARIRSLRYVYVRGADFLIPSWYGIMGMGLNSALCFFPGLQLNTLTVENMALDASGQNLATHDYGYGLTSFDLKSLSFTKGWKNLEYVSGPLCLLPSEQREFEVRVTQHQTEQDEADFTIEMPGKIRPQLSHLAGFRESIASGANIAPEAVAMVAELDEWYAKHPEAGKPGEFSEVKEVKEVRMRVRRGEKADYILDGQGMDDSKIDELINSDWVELRKGDDSVIDDSMHMPFHSGPEERKFYVVG